MSFLFYCTERRWFHLAVKANFYSNEYTQIDYDLRKIYLMNPQIHNLSGLLNLIQVMQPYHFSIYVGNDSPLDNHYRIYRDNFRFDHMYSYNCKADCVNLMIKGKIFDVCCLVDKDTIIPFSNVIYQYIFHESLNHKLSADTNTLCDSMQPFFKKLYAAIRLLFTGRKNFIYSEEIKDRK